MAHPVRRLVLHAGVFLGTRLSSSRAARQERSLRSRRCTIGIRRLRTRLPLARFGAYEEDGPV
jgi:hypothetical protein